MANENSYNEPEKLLYHFFRKDMLSYWSRQRIRYAILAVSVILILIGLIGKVDILAIIGVLMLFTAVILLLTNRINAAVIKLDMVLLPISQVRYGDSSLLVDRSGLMPETIFQYATLSQDDILRLKSEYDDLIVQTSKMPLLLTNDKNLQIASDNLEYKKEHLRIFSEESALIKQFKAITDCVQKQQNHSVSLRLLAPDQQLLDELKRIPKCDSKNIVEQDAEEDIVRKSTLMDGIVSMSMDKGNSPLDVDNLCEEVIKTSDEVMDKWKYTLDYSLHSIAVPYSNKYFEMVDKSSYNYFCPNCNKELMERLNNNKYLHDDVDESFVTFPPNTKMKIVDYVEGLYKCPLCEQTTKNPIAKHKMEDELFTPVYDKLYEENLIERLKIFNHIVDEKRQYSDKAQNLFHEVMREARGKVDTLKSKIRSLFSEVKAAGITVRDMKNLMTKYDKITKETTAKIEKDLNNYEQSIREANEKSRKAIDSAVEEYKSNSQEATEKYAALERADQKARDDTQRQIAEDTRAMREIEEVRAERSGINKKKGLIFFRQSERDKARIKLNG